jgi:hypothetical protein
VITPSTVLIDQIVMVLEPAMSRFSAPEPELEAR